MHEIRSLSDLHPSDVAEMFVLLTQKERGVTRDGKPYFRVTFEDAHRRVVSMIWQDTPWFHDCEASWYAGQAFRCIARYSETSYGPQLDLQQIRAAIPEDEIDGFRRRDLLPQASYDVDAVWDELRQLVQNDVPLPALVDLTIDLLDEHAEAARIVPGSARHHHTVTGGWLLHTMSVARIAVFLSEHYDLDDESRSVVICGAVLHDVGKLREFEMAGSIATASLEGRLLGHILLGREMVRTAAERTPELDEEVRLRLEHVVAAHQDGPEHGSPVKALTLDAMLVHLIDELDTRFQMVQQAIDDEAPGELFTSRNNPLRREFYTGRSGKKE